jgi:hypothetical protein
VYCSKKQRLSPFSRGEDVVLSWTNPTGQSVSGWTLELFVSSDESGPPIPLASSGVVGLPDADHTIRVTLTSLDTSGFPVGPLFIEVWRTDAGFRAVLVDDEVEVEDPIAELTVAPPNVIDGNDDSGLFDGGS